MIGRIQHPSHPAAALTAANPVLLAGEIVYESDTRRHKIGAAPPPGTNCPMPGLYCPTPSRPP